MAKRIRLDLDGVTAVAILHEAAAPTTVARLWAALPIAETLRHVRWSGDAGYLLVTRLAGLDQPLENPITFYPPGGIAFRRDHGEIAISYGQAQARDHMAPAGWACHLATLEANAEAFLAKVHATRAEGGKPLRMTREAGE
jgi:Protein of unknown function (DUF3830)